MVSRDDATDDTDGDDDSLNDYADATGSMVCFVLKTITCNTSLARREC